MRLPAQDYLIGSSQRKRKLDTTSTPPAFTITRNERYDPVKAKIRHADQALRANAKAVIVPLL